MLQKVIIAGLTVDPSSNTPIVVLKTEEAEEKTLPIWIGLLEASAIISELQNVRFERPMTHDLFKNFSEFLQLSVSKVEVCDLRDNTFYARIFFNSGEQAGFDIDARPSDAIALALRFDAPIFVDDAIFDKVTVKTSAPAKGGDAKAADESEEGKKWAEYLDNLSPDDFGSRQ